MPPTLAILGAAGAVGRNLSSELTRRHRAHRVIGRDRAKLERAFGATAEIATADLADAAQTERALTGIDTVIYTVGVPYHQFELHPVLMRSALEASRRAGVTRLAVVSSVYSYGRPQTERVAETHPREPHTRKGRFRKEQEDLALAAHQAGGLRTLVLRLPDFYGPHAEQSLADGIVRAALAGKAANWLGSPDLPHEFVYVPDAASVLADLVSREDSFGQTWNYGGPGTITGRAFITAIYSEAGHTPKFRTAGPLMLRLGGLFNPLLRELVEMQYLAETPVVLDDTKLARHLGTLPKTPYADGIRATVDWYRSQGLR